MKLAHVDGIGDTSKLEENPRKYLGKCGEQQISFLAERLTSSNLGWAAQIQANDWKRSVSLRQRCPVKLLDSSVHV
jgi:hypothetical protein